MIALASALAAAVLAVLWKGTRAALAERASFHPRRGAVPRPDGADRLDGLREAAFRTPDGLVVRGSWVPSRNRAAVVLAHGSMADRNGVLIEARALQRAGFGALFFDWPGHGESDGDVTLGSHEIAAMRAAVDFVTTQAGVDPARVGALGVSVGAALVAVSASRDPRLRALCLVGAFTDSDVLTRWQYGGWGPITALPALWVDHRYMVDGPLRPIDAMRDLGDRTVLLISGADDRVVPPAMADELFRAIPGAHKELWIVPRAGHADYEEVTGGEYTERIVRFFQDALGVPAAP